MDDQDIILNVLMNAKGVPLSTREISRITGIRWDNVKKQLNILYSKRKTVHKIEKGNIILWYITYKARDPVGNIKIGYIKDF